MGVGGQRHAPAALPLVNTLYPLYTYWGLGGPKSWSGQGFDLSTVQPIVSRYAYWGILDPYGMVGPRHFRR
jgi:hypothetical protein